MQPESTVMKKIYNKNISVDELGGQVLIYIGRQIKKRGEENEKESLDFLKYFGLDSGNLRQMIALDEPFEPLSGQEYGWNDFYGKKAVMNVEQYMRKEAALIKEKLDKKAEAVLKKFREYFVPALTQRGDAGFAARILDSTDKNSLYALLCREKELDYGYLMIMNKQTYDEIKDEEERAGRERGGIFGHREESMDDLFTSVDNFLQQRYEIYRYKTIENIYENILKILNQYKVHFPDGIVEPELQDAFEHMNIYRKFSVDFLKTLDPVHFLADISWDELKTYLFEKYSASQDISLIIEGIQNNCLVVKKKQAILSEYDIIGNVDYERLSLREKMELLRQLQQIIKKPVKESCFEIQDERDFDSLLENEEFMETLASSLRSIHTNKETVEKLQQLL